MKKYYSIAFFFFSICALMAQSGNTPTKISLSKRDSALLKRDSIAMIRIGEEAKSAATFDNLIAYVNDYDDHFKEWMYNKYGIYVDYSYKLTLYAKSYMDSLIFLKYGKDIYQKARKEVDSVYQNVPSWMDIDGSYFGIPSPYYLCGPDKLFKDIHSMIDVKTVERKENRTEVEIEADFIIDTLGNLKNPRIVKKGEREINEKIIKALKNLPCKWMPGVDDSGRKLSVKVSIKLRVC